jgi:hypothetical protein
VSRTVQEWERSLQSAWALAKGQRLAELRGRRSRTFDERGLHPLSLEVGRIYALQEIEPVLREADFNILELRVEAEQEALEEFRKELEERYAQHS